MVDALVMPPDNGNPDAQKCRFALLLPAYYAKRWVAQSEHWTPFLMEHAHVATIIGFNDCPKTGHFYLLLTPAVND